MLSFSFWKYKLDTELRALHNSIVCTHRKYKIFKSEAYAASPHQPNVGRTNIIGFIFFFMGLSVPRLKFMFCTKKMDCAKVLKL